MLKVQKNGRIRTINESQLSDHKQMGWSVVEDVIVKVEPTKTKKTKTKTKPSIDVKEEFEKELEKELDEALNDAIDENTPEENE